MYGSRWAYLWVIVLIYMSPQYRCPHLWSIGHSQGQPTEIKEKEWKNKLKINKYSLCIYLCVLKQVLLRTGLMNGHFENMFNLELCGSDYALKVT